MLMTALAAFESNSITALIKKVRNVNTNRDREIDSSHNRLFTDLRQKVDILRRDFFIAKKEGILGAEGKLLPPQSDECKTMLKHVETVLGCIDRNMKKAHETIPFGGKLFVQGLPFWHERCKENQLYAFNIYHDSGTNRDMEISFKRSLLRLYETRYMKFTADGKPVQ